MEKLRFAVLGTGFWANYQIRAWMEIGGTELVAVHDRVGARAEAIAERFGVPRVYEDAAALLDREDLDFVDLITDAESHAQLTMMAAEKGISVVCQKPMAPTFEAAVHMVSFCAVNGVSLFVHENWRWQAPLRKLKELLDINSIGKVFKARITFCSAFPVFDNQPFLRDLRQFILTDIGSHILDVCRFLFGEGDSLYCTTSSVNPAIRGEDVANVLLKMKNGISCYAEMSYASVLEYESFPQTFVLVEGENGSISLTRNFELRISTRAGTHSLAAEPQTYRWADPDYALVHSSAVACNRNILTALRNEAVCETSGEDNLETVRLVHACYASATTNRTVHLTEFLG